MKTVLLLLVSGLAPLFCMGTVRTVSNDPNNPAQFNTVQAAINASVHGDTVYVNGTQFPYADFTINKRLVMIGAGYKVANQLNLISYVNQISLFRDAGVNDASGSIIMGFYIYCRVTTAGGSMPISNLTLHRNVLGAGGCVPGASISNANNWLIYNNIMYGAGLDAASTNILIQNNILTNSISGGNQSSIIIDHNIFQNSGLNNIRFATITNNIFVRNSGNILDANVTSNTFNNNLSILTTIGPTAPTNSFLGGPNTGAGNFVGVDPLFESVADFNTFNYNNNYRLKNTSTVRNAGTDGTDLGIYGGSYPFPSGGAPGSGYDTSPLPPIPQITSANIQNSSLQPGAQLQINIQATVNN
ncbi:MAG: hypothetical protein ACOYXA_04045 [Bacteroidota bacterium]